LTGATAGWIFEQISKIHPVMEAAMTTPEVAPSTDPRNIAGLPMPQNPALLFDPSRRTRVLRRTEGPRGSAR
jgi:hypothetical protein